MKTLKLITILFVLLSSAVMAEMPIAEIPAFNKLDINRDKLLSKYEIEISVISIDITSSDKDNDGALNEEEYTSFVRKLRAIELNKS